MSAAQLPGQRGVHRLDAYMAMERAAFNAISAAQTMPQPERAALLLYCIRLSAELLPMPAEVVAVLREADLAADHGLLVAAADEVVAAMREQGAEPTGGLLQLRRRFAASAARFQLPQSDPDQPAWPPPA